MIPLEREFHNAMLEVYETACGLGYPATRFKQMVEQYGGLQAAQRLLSKGEFQSGLIWLWAHSALDVSMEALVLQARFRSLFSAEQIAEAHERLDILDYRP